GNIVFHLALVGLLIAMAWGHMVHYRGQALVVEGRSFVNAPLDYDAFNSGPLLDDTSLSPFRCTLDSFTSRCTLDAHAREFRADVTVSYPDGRVQPEIIEVNHPLDLEGARIYLMGNGYAPELTVRDSDGELAFQGPVPFLPQDVVYTSTDRKSTRLNSSHVSNSYAVFCLKKKRNNSARQTADHKASPFLTLLVN